MANKINEGTIGQAVFSELDRLGLSANQDSCSGLMADGLSDEVLVYDDCANGCYDGPQMLAFLKSLKIGDAVLSGESSQNIWSQIESFLL